MQRLIAAGAILVLIPAAGGAATLSGASSGASVQPHPRKIDLRLVNQSSAMPLAPFHSAGVIAEMGILPSARLQLGLLKSRLGDSPRAPKSRKLGLSFKMKF